MNYGGTWPFPPSGVPCDVNPYPMCPPPPPPPPPCRGYNIQVLYPITDGKNPTKTIFLPIGSSETVRPVIMDISVNATANLELKLDTRQSPCQPVTGVLITVAERIGKKAYILRKSLAYCTPCQTIEVDVGGTAVAGGVVFDIMVEFDSSPRCGDC